VIRRTRTKLTKVALLSKRWPSCSMAEVWLKSHRFSLDALNCSLGMAPDHGIALSENPGIRTSVGLPLDSRDHRDDAIIIGAEYFTTFRFGGRGLRDRREFKTLLSASADAADDPRCMIYAVYSKTADVPIPQHQVQRYLVLRGEAPMVDKVVAGGVYQKLNGELCQVVLTRKDSLVCLMYSLEIGDRRRRKVCDAGVTFCCKLDGPLPKGYGTRLKVPRK
jgi:hypothetical protein